MARTTLHNMMTIDDVLIRYRCDSESILRELTHAACRRKSKRASICSGRIVVHVIEEPPTSDGSAGRTHPRLTQAAGGRARQTPSTARADSPRVSAPRACPAPPPPPPPPSPFPPPPPPATVTPP